MKIYDASGFNSKLTGSFTGSFYGDGSNLSGIVTYTKSEISGSSNLAISNILDGTTPVQSASRATTASFALNAGAGSGFPFSGSAEITGSLYVSGGSISGSFVGDGSGLTGILIEESTITSASFSNVNEYTASHNFNTKQLLVSTYFNDDTQFFPQQVKILDDSKVALKFNTSTSGRVVIAKAGHVVSGSAESIDFNNVQNKPTLISSSAQIASSDLDMNGNKVLFANVYGGTGDLPSAATYHGMFAHVHSTGQGYFAHAGQWVELATSESIQTSYLKNTTDTFNGDLTITGSVNINNNITTIDPTEVDQTETLTSQTVTHQTQDAWYVFSADNTNYLTGGTSIADDSFLTGNDSGHLAHISFGPRSTSTGLLPQSIVDFLNELPGVSGISTSYSLGTVPGKLTDFQGPVTFRVERDSNNFFEVEVHNVFIGWHSSDTFVNVAFSGNSSTTVTHVAGNRNFHDSGSNDIQVPVFQTSNFIDGAGTWQSSTGGYTISFTKQVPVPFKASINGDITATGTAYVTSSKVYNNNTSSGSLSFWQGSQSEYDAISSSADPNTVYFVI